MVQISRYMVRMTIANMDHQQRQVEVEILAYNKKQAEKKATNTNMSRNSRMLSCVATLLA